MGFYVLTMHGQDAEKWRHIAHVRIPAELRDVHMSEPYMKAEELLGNKPLLAVYEYDEYFVAQAFVLREVNVSGIRALDISSPNGYGGPWSNHGHTLWNWFQKSFLEWCAEQGIVSEFCALNPLILNHQLSLMKSADFDIKERKKVVVVDLEKPGLLENRYRDRRFAGIVAARRAKVEIVAKSNLGKNWTITDEEALYRRQFIKLYRDSMMKKAAATRWFFPDEYVASLCSIGDLFAAEVDGEVESMALQLPFGSSVYYHLAVNVGKHPNVGANDLLIHDMMVDAQRRGFKRFHLGGGVTSAPDDGVFHYKSGFSDDRASAQSYFRIFDQKKYTELCEAKAQKEIYETGKEFSTNFLPLYRREAA